MAESVADGLIVDSSRVLISYAHEVELVEHKEVAYELCESLRRGGVDAHIDRYVEHDPPFRPRWMADEIASARFVLCLASPLYKERCEARGDEFVGRGARWEGLIITEELYVSPTTAHKKFIPILLSGCDVKDIPDVVRPIGTTHYRWPEEDEDLYRRLTNQPRFIPSALGQIVKLPTRQPEVGDSGEGTRE